MLNYDMFYILCSWCPGVFHAQGNNRYFRNLEFFFYFDLTTYINIIKVMNNINVNKNNHPLK